MLYYNNSHGQNEVNQVKKKTLVPLIIFLLGICLISLIVYKTDAHEKEQRHITAQLNVATYGAVSYTHLDVYKRQTHYNALPSI